MTEYAWVIMKVPEERYPVISKFVYSTTKLTFDGDSIDKAVLGIANSIENARLLLPHPTICMTCSKSLHANSDILEWWFLSLGDSPHDPVSRSIN